MDTVPLFLGGLFFMFCLGAGFVYSLFIAKGKARWGGLAIAAVGFIGLLPFAMVAGPVNPTFSSVSGTYEGNFGGGTNTFTLHPDGKFDQKFVTEEGKVYINRGTWKIDDIGLGNGVDFDHLLMPMDMTGIAQRPEITSFANASIHSLEHAIYFNEDNDICIKRTSN